MADKRPSGKAIALLVAVFVLGGIVGILGVHLAGNMRTNRHQRFMDRLSQQLQLTPAQKTQVQQILVDNHKRWMAVVAQSQQEIHPQLEAIRADTHAKILAILTPDQQKKFNEFLAQFAAQRAAHPRRQTPAAPPAPPKQHPPSPTAQPAPKGH